MDIWQSGSPAVRQGSGWLGRHLDRTPGRGGAFRAVSIGNSLPEALTGEQASGVAIAALTRGATPGTVTASSRCVSCAPPRHPPAPRTRR